MISPYVYVGLKQIVIDTEIEQAKDIIDIVAKHFGMSRELILQKSRKRTILLPRQIAMFIVRKRTSIGLVKIGEAFGGFHHTTVINSLTQINNDLATNQEYVSTQIQTINKIIDEIIFKTIPNEQDRANISSN